jgi:hypothetical protein
MIELVPVLVAAAFGGAIAHFTGKRRAGPWIAAGLAIAMNIGLAYAIYYYSTHLAGGPPEPQRHFQEFVGLSATGSVIGGVGSFLLCLLMQLAFDRDRQSEV